MTQVPVWDGSSITLLKTETSLRRKKRVGDLRTWTLRCSLMTISSFDPLKLYERQSVNCPIVHRLSFLAGVTTIQSFDQPMVFEQHMFIKYPCKVNESPLPCFVSFFLLVASVKDVDRMDSFQFHPGLSCPTLCWRDSLRYSTAKCIQSLFIRASTNLSCNSADSNDEMNLIRFLFKVDRRTQYGYVRGTTYNVASQESFYPKYISVFLGIPYARPPGKASMHGMSLASQSLLFSWSLSIQGLLVFDDRYLNELGPSF